MSLGIRIPLKDGVLPTVEKVPRVVLSGPLCLSGGGVGGEDGWYVLHRSCLLLSQSWKVREHEHPLCLLIGHTQFKIVGERWT